MERNHMESMHLEISNWIQDLRVHAGLTLQEAALQVQKPSEKLKDLESGDPIPLYLLARLAQLYQLSGDEFLSKIHSIQERFMASQRF